MPQKRMFHQLSSKQNLKPSSVAKKMVKKMAELASTVYCRSGYHTATPRQTAAAASTRGTKWGRRRSLREKMPSATSSSKRKRILYQ